MSENKVRLPKEVHEAIVRLKKEHGTWTGHDLFYVTVSQYGHCQYKDNPDVRIVHKWTMSRELTFAKALLSGYEVEQSPEDRVMELIDEWEKLRHEYKDRGEKFEFEKYSDFIYGAKMVLMCLNIKIEGVNT